MGKAMKKNAFRLTAAVILLAGNMTAQAGLEEGISAYRYGNYSQALRELAPLAEKGEAKAQRVLGEMYDAGIGVPQDQVKAAFWYRKAAEQGHPKAQTALAMMYDRGVGVSQDAKEAAMWLHKAAEQGEQEAQYLLGNMYQWGHGAISIDLVQAHKWFSLAVKTGFEAAHDNAREVEAQMSADQIGKAHKLAEEWLATHQLPDMNAPLK